MEHYYLEIRTVHISAALTSGALLLLRAATFNLIGASWPLAWQVRWLAYTIDTILLTAALMLMTIIQQYPLVDTWLTMKVLLLLLYIMAGYVAMRGPTRGVRLASLGAAALLFGFVYTIARAHHPLGLFA